jgi:hypothetical protein
VPKETHNQSIHPYFFALLVLSFIASVVLVALLPFVALKRKASGLSLRDNVLSHST